MGKDWYQDIVDFHKGAGHYIGSKPEVPSSTTKQLRLNLIDEEVNETLQAIKEDNLEGVADGITDSIVVLLGTAVSYGVDIRPIWDEVHRTNMAKIGGGKRRNGKSLKPLGWQPPNINKLLMEQGKEVNKNG